MLELLTAKKGVMIAIAGFDELMLLLNEKLGFPLQADEIEKQAKVRATAYRNSFEEIQESLKPTPGASREKKEVSAAVAKLVEGQPGWWGWELKARSESDPEKKEQIYRAGLKELKDSWELMYYFADFLTDVRKKHDEAEVVYRRAIKLAPDNTTVVGNFANFLVRVRKKHDEAEVLYRRAIELAPDNANINANFVSFNLARGKISEAKKMAGRAWPLCATARGQAAAEVTLYRGLITRIEQRDDTPALGRLKTMLLGGFQRLDWSFDDVLTLAADKLSADDNKLYTALAAAILDEHKVTALEEFPMEGGCAHRAGRAVARLAGVRAGQEKKKKIRVPPLRSG